MTNDTALIKAALDVGTEFQKLMGSAEVAALKAEVERLRAEIERLRGALHSVIVGMAPLIEHLERNASVDWSQLTRQEGNTVLTAYGNAKRALETP